MIPLIKRSFFRTPLAVYTLAVTFIFVLGFFIHYGREARHSKSWQYVMSDDQLVYWSIAKGRMMSPRCDGNPYYYEEQGTRNIIPFTTAEVIGLVSKYTKIPLEWFFPLWQILMPLFVWFVIAVCCWKLWNYPLSVSAAAALLLLLGTLFCPWPGIHTTLFRFSRPLDGIAPIFLWISLIYKGDPGNKKHHIAIIMTAALTLWLQPFYAVFCLWITVFEYMSSIAQRGGFLKHRLYFHALGSSLVSGLIFADYAFHGKNITAAYLPTRDAPGGAPLFCLLMTLLMLIVVVSVVIFFYVCLKKEVSPLDRLMTAWTFFGVLIYATLKPLSELTIHMLYFAPVMILSSAGWIHEKISILKGTRYFSFFSRAVVILSVFFLAAALISKKNFFSLESRHYFVYIPQYFFIMLFSFWLSARFHLIKTWVMQKKTVCGIILLLAVAGFWKMPLSLWNRDFSFGGGYQWLKAHAQQNDVVLTASFKCMYSEYLFYKTGLKSYFTDHGQASEFRRTPKAFRINFVNGLLLGLLDHMPHYGSLPLAQKLRFFKLDYVLIPKPSPFLEEVTTQLKGHLQEVYQDQKCLLWKVI